MSARVRFEFGNMFETPSDLVVIPCSTAGTITQTTKEHLSRYNIPLPEAPIPLGGLQIVKLAPGNRAFKRAAFAASVASNASSRSVIRALGERLGEMTRQGQIRVIAAPLFGTGAGGLDVVTAAKAIHAGYTERAVGGARLLIHVMDRADFAVLDRLELDEHDDERESRYLSLKGLFEGSLPADDTNEQRHESHRGAATRRGVFVSYSHRDRKWLERLQIHLRPLERDHSLAVWDDTKIRPGTDWRGEIRHAIQTAKVAILLVSADFLASEFIAKNELPPLLRAAKEDGALILPVIVSPCRFVKTENLSGFQAVNDPDKPLNSLKGANRERILTQVVDAVEAALLDSHSRP